MANIYVRSTDGSDSDNGSTWALAKASLAGAAAIDAAGDTIYVSHSHSENQTASITITLAGTASNPVRVICGNDAAEPPTTGATSAIVKATGNFSVNIEGWAYFRGIRFHSADTNSSGLGINLATGSSNTQIYEDCEFYNGSTHANGKISVGNTAHAAGGLVVWRNCRVKFFTAGQWIAPAYGLEWHGGRLTADSAATTTLFRLQAPSGRGAGVIVDGVDLSTLASTCNLFDLSDYQAMGGFGGLIRNCKLPSSWSGSLVANAASTRLGWRFEMHNCDAGDTNYRIWVEDFYGSIKSETTVVKSSGASDGTTSLAWKMASNTQTAEDKGRELVSPEIVRWNETTGSAVTITVDILHDSLTNLQDDEIWLEVQYLGTSGFPVSSFLTDRKGASTTIPWGDPLASNADQATSSATWTTTGLTNPNEQQLSVTFTPQEKGFIHAKVVLAKASYTVYVDPLLQVS
jgi:hypothetical protein